MMAKIVSTLILLLARVACGQQPDCTVSAVGIGSAFNASPALSLAASDHELRLYLESQGGTWLVIDPVMLYSAHPHVFDLWISKLKTLKRQPPAVIWYKRVGGKVVLTGVNQCGPDTTGATLLAWAKSHVPNPTDTLTIQGKTYGLGYRPSPRRVGSLRNVVYPMPSLPENKFPVGIDLRGEFQFLHNQGVNGICTSEALTECYEAACFRHFGSQNSIKFSADFLATIGNGWNGADPDAIANILGNTGIVPLSAQPDWSHTLPANWKVLAAQNRALGVYASQPSSGRGIVAAAIARGLPVAVPIAAGSGFVPDAHGVITYRRGSGTTVNHVMVFAGGIFTVEGVRCFLVLNSWGPWGIDNSGWCYLEERFADDSNELWAVVVPSAAPHYRFDAPP